MSYFINGATFRLLSILQNQRKIFVKPWPKVISGHCEQFIDFADQSNLTRPSYFTIYRDPIRRWQSHFEMRV